jgi:hypothetical protein
MRNIIWGAVIIAIGLIRGDSVFRGDFTVFSVAFDVLGVFLIVRGLVTLKQARAQASAPPSATARPPRQPAQMP